MPFCVLQMTILVAEVRILTKKEIGITRVVHLLNQIVVVMISIGTEVVV